MAVSASTPPLPAVFSAKPATARSPPRPPPGFLPLRAHRALAPRLGPVGTWRTFRAEVIKTQREKQQTEVAVEESFPVRETAPLDGADDPMVPTDESWVVKLEQSVNIFLTESVIMVLDNLYRDRNYARFFVLETIAIMPDFSYWRQLLGCRISHLYRCFICTRPLAGGEELIT